MGKIPYIFFFVSFVKVIQQILWLSKNTSGKNWSQSFVLSNYCITACFSFFLLLLFFYAACLKMERLFPKCLMGNISND